MDSNKQWKWSEDTLRTIILQIIERKEEYEKEISNLYDQGVVDGYNFVVDSIKSQLEARGYEFEQWLEDK
ncbi:MAG: hypothetical protein Q4E02_00845 [Lagierella massiliensis]|nr:hypothetical protein [Lagierella massiliensis]